MLDSLHKSAPILLRGNETIIQKMCKMKHTLTYFILLNFFHMTNVSYHGHFFILLLCFHTVDISFIFFFFFIPILQFHTTVTAFIPLWLIYTNTLISYRFIVFAYHRTYNFIPNEVCFTFALLLSNSTEQFTPPDGKFLLNLRRMLTTQMAHTHTYQQTGNWYRSLQNKNLHPSRRVWSP